MEALIKQRASAKAAITRIETFINKNENNTTINLHEYSTRESALVKAFEKYTSIQDQIEEIDDSQEQDRVETENKFFSIHAALKTKIQSGPIPAVSVPTETAQTAPLQLDNSTHAQVKLPSVTIPSFTGKYEDWKSFIDLFTALIDSNAQLANVQKFVYLKSTLKNEPFNLISKLKITNENYTVALNMLKERYDNKLVIINNHIKNLLDAPPIGSCNAVKFTRISNKCKTTIK